MPVVIGSHPNNDIEDILILETNEQGSEKKYENNTFRLFSLPSTSNDESSTRNKSKIELKEYILWPQTPERKGTRQSEMLPYVITSSSWNFFYENNEIEKNPRSKKTSRNDWQRRLSKKPLERKPQLTKIQPKLPENM
ncbi:hypothetical protein JTB14_018582 [Gonioctena quinquepunctata]|nr:hypothetical protein JTB14_018582 [Gonioctena quinquepunctata]